MTRLISIHEAAELEINEAADFYDLESPGLGSAFLDEVQKAIEAQQCLTGSDAYDIVTNGTFFTWTGNEMIVHGSLLAHKKELVQTKTAKAAKRGGLAILESGLIVIER